MDLNKVELLLYIKLFFKMLKLIASIFTMSYFLGQFWYIKCDIENDYRSSEFYKIKNDIQPTNEVGENYIEYFGLDKKSHPEIAIIGIYYSMTTLSTVGFGDYHPRSDSERFLACFLLIFGVSVFSYIMGDILTLIESWKELNEVNEDGDNLNRFFNVLRKFNNMESLDLEWQSGIEQHFSYIWDKDKNFAVRDDNDVSLLEQLP